MVGFFLCCGVDVSVKLGVRVNIIFFIGFLLVLLMYIEMFGVVDKDVLVVCVYERVVLVSKRVFDVNVFVIKLVMLNVFVF